MYVTMDLKARNKALRGSSSKITNTERIMLRRCTTATGFIPNKRLRRGRTLPEVPYELVLEILVRLPVKSLLRFKSVCKTWHATIACPSFIRTHLQLSTSNHQVRPSFLVTPFLLDSVKRGGWPTTFSSNMCFYRYQPGPEASASLACTTDFRGEFGSVYPFAHCDGLVLIPTDTKMYVLNPATRDLLTLPESRRSMLTPSSVCNRMAGFGIDPSTNKYKVVRCFSWSSDDDGAGTGMEVFTIGSNGSAAASWWRDAAGDPPYPITAWQNATFFKGCLFWVLFQIPNFDGLVELSPETRLLRFCLRDETFSFTMHPPGIGLDHDNLSTHELNGEFCVAQFDSPQKITIWMTSDGVNPQWDRRYTLDVTISYTLAISPCGIFLENKDCITQYNFQSQEMEEVACLKTLRYHGSGTDTIDYSSRNLFFIHVIPCIESLVPLANARRLA